MRVDSRKRKTRVKRNVWWPLTPTEYFSFSFRFHLQTLRTILCRVIFHTIYYKTDFLPFSFYIWIEKSRRFMKNYFENHIRYFQKWTEDWNNIKSQISKKLHAFFSIFLFSFSDITLGNFLRGYLFSSTLTRQSWDELWVIRNWNASKRNNVREMLFRFVVRLPIHRAELNG